MNDIAETYNLTQDELRYVVLSERIARRGFMLMNAATRGSPEAVERMAVEIQFLAKEISTLTFDDETQTRLAVVGIDIASKRAQATADAFRAKAAA